MFIDSAAIFQMIHLVRKSINREVVGRDQDCHPSPVGDAAKEGQDLLAGGRVQSALTGELLQQGKESYLCRWMDWSPGKAPCSESPSATRRRNWRCLEVIELGSHLGRAKLTT